MVVPRDARHHARAGIGARDHHAMTRPPLAVEQHRVGFESRRPDVVEVHARDRLPQRFGLRLDVVIVVQARRDLIRRGNGERVVLEGAPDPRRVIVVEFPTMADVVRFHASPEYTVLRRMREAAATAQIIAIDGFATDGWEAAVAASGKLSV